MRILLSCLQSAKRHPIPAYQFWRPYFIQGLQEAGHEVLEVPGVDWAEGLTYARGAALEAWRARTWDATRSFVREEQRRRPIHMFLSYLYPQQIEGAAIKELLRIGIPCVNFFCDNVREFRRVPSEYHPFSLHWVPEFEALSMYRVAGLAHIHAPMPCWIPTELRSVPTAETEPPTFIGSADILRRDLLVRALRSGADFVVRGSGWIGGSNYTRKDEQQHRSIATVVARQLTTVRVHGAGALLRKLENRFYPMRAPPLPQANIRHAPVDQEEYFRITREAMVTIGINRVPSARASNRLPLVYSRLRDIEAPMLGACYLTEWTEGIAAMYELGEEIETYRTAAELSVKLADQQKYPARRLIMRKRAQQRAIHDHSVARSIARIIEKLGLSIDSTFRPSETEARG